MLPNLPDLNKIRFFFHGTVRSETESVLGGIDFSRCRQDTDFGQGFYLTASKRKAIEWSEVKGNLKGEEDRTIIVYRFQPSPLNTLKGSIFPTDDDNWKRFVYNNRTRKVGNEYHNNRDARYDFVWGRIADGDAGLTKAVLKGLIEEQDYLDQLKGFSNQFSIHTQAGVNLICVENVIYL